MGKNITLLPLRCEFSQKEISCIRESVLTVGNFTWSLKTLYELTEIVWDTLCIKTYLFFFLHIFWDNTTRNAQKLCILQGYRIDTVTYENKEIFRGFVISVNVQFKINWELILQSHFNDQNFICKVT